MFYISYLGGSLLISVCLPDETSFFWEQYQTKTFQNVDPDFRLVATPLLAGQTEHSKINSISPRGNCYFLFINFKTRYIVVNFQSMMDSYPTLKLENTQAVFLFGSENSTQCCKKLTVASTAISNIWDLTISYSYIWSGILACTKM